MTSILEIDLFGEKCKRDKVIRKAQQGSGE